MRRLLVLLLSVLCFAVPAWIEAQPQRPALPAVAGPTTAAQVRQVVTQTSGTGSLLFQGGNLGDATATSLTSSGKVQSGPGTFGVWGGQNANGEVTCAFFPDGDATSVPGLQSSTTGTGMIESNVIYSNQQIAWLNEAWSFVKCAYDTGSKANTIAAMPGIVGNGGYYRFQMYMPNGDFVTDMSSQDRISRNVGWSFRANVPAGTDPNPNRLTNLTFDPTAWGTILSTAVACNPSGSVNPGCASANGVEIRLHTNGGVGLPTGTRISSYDASSITFTGGNATATLTGAMFTLGITAPTSNGSFGTPYLSPMYIPFVGDIDTATNRITNLKFDPTRVGIVTTATVTNDSCLPQSSMRVIDFTNDTITVGDSITGQPVTAGVSSCAGATFTLDQGGSAVTTFTADSSPGSAVLTSVSIDPVAQSIPTDGTVSWDATKWMDGLSNDTFRNSTVTAVTSTTIDMSTNSTLSVAQGSKVVGLNGVLSGWRFSLSTNGSKEMIYEAGWCESPVRAYGFCIDQAIPVYHGGTQIINTDGEWVGPIDPNLITGIQTPAAGVGQALEYVPTGFGGSNLLVDSADLSTGSWSGTNASAALSSRTGPYPQVGQYTLTSSAAGGLISQSVSVPADTSSYWLRAFFDSTSAAGEYRIETSFSGGGNDCSVKYDPSNGHTSSTGATTDYGSVPGATYADGSTRRMVWLRCPNDSKSSVSVRIFANGLSGAASSLDVSLPMLTKVTSDAPPTGTPPAQVTPTLSAVAYASPGQISPLLVPDASVPIVVTAASASVGPADKVVVADRAGTVTLTLPSPATNCNRRIRVVTRQNQTVVSASSNVVAITGGSAGTAMVAGTAGKWVDLDSDCSGSWLTTAGN